MGLDGEREKTVQLEVRGVRRPVQLEGHEQSLGCTGWCASQRGEGVSSARPPDAREDLVCALKLLANQQTGGDSLVDMIFEGLQEQNRLNITNAPTSFIEVGQPRTGEDRRPGQELGGNQGGQAQVQQGDLPACGHLGRGERVDTQ